MVFVMVDIKSLQKKMVLAKDMVSKGLAASVDDAYAIIEQGGMVKEFQPESEDFFISTARREQEEETKIEETVKMQQETLQRMDNSAALIAKVQRLEQQLEKFQEFFKKYQQVNDANLREVDTRLKDMAKRVASMPQQSHTTQSAPNQQQQQQHMSQSQQQQQLPSSGQQQSQPPAQQAQTQQQQQQSGGADVNDPKYAVENIFNNSHNKLGRK